MSKNLFWKDKNKKILIILIRPTVGFLDGHELGEIVNEPLDVLRVLADGSQFLGVEIGRQLFA